MSTIAVGQQISVLELAKSIRPTISEKNMLSITRFAEDTREAEQAIFSSIAWTSVRPGTIIELGENIHLGMNCLIGQSRLVVQEGTEIARLEGPAETRGEFTMLLRLPDGYIIRVIELSDQPGKPIRIDLFPGEVDGRNRHVLQGFWNSWVRDSTETSLADSGFNLFGS